MTLPEIKALYEKTCATWRPSIRAVHLVDVYEALNYVEVKAARKGR